MNKEIPEHIYLKDDIDKAFNMGVEAVVSAFEKTIGLSQDKQRIVLNRIKDMLLETKAETVMNKH